MPVATFVSEGFAVDYTPSSDVSAGDIVDLGDCVGIATHDISANTLGSIQVYGVYDVAKYTGEAVSLWADVYYDAGTNTATGTIGYSEARIGKCVKAAASGDSTVRVLVFPRTG